LSTERADDTADDGQLLALAEAWLAGDPDPETRDELRAVIDSGHRGELRERVASSLEFGTAGIRGVMGAGPNRMNAAVVRRTARGLAQYLLDRVVDARVLPVVVGFDARNNSRAFAEQAVSVLAAAGLHVRFFEQPVPTPLVAYAARQLGASAAVVITASHNPAAYNGLKVYGPDAIQISSPTDVEIAQHIERVGSAVDIPFIVQAFDSGHPHITRLPEALFDRYLMEIEAARASSARAPLSIAYTPLHGVGLRFAEPALRYAGHGDLHVVAEQAEPDPGFPTVPFPNPEEPGAMDRVIALAQQVGADLVLANDPDADRLAVAVPLSSGRFVPLTGNQVGILLADHLLGQAGAFPRALVVSSIVSSPMLDAVAAEHGARCERTLTGFKWIWRAARDLEQGYRFVLGYEEALGYSVGSVVRDKDGIGAAIAFADLAAHCKALGVSVRERLVELYRRHGLWVSVQKSVHRPGIQGAREIAAAMSLLRKSAPELLAGRRVVSSLDYSEEAQARPVWLGATDLLGLDLAGGGRVLVRPSGTEPKLKIYVDLRVSLEEGDEVGLREREATLQAESIAVDAIGYLALTE
jgi:phosphomannomutase